MSLAPRLAALFALALAHAPRGRSFQAPLWANTRSPYFLRRSTLHSAATALHSTAQPQLPHVVPGAAVAAAPLLVVAEEAALAKGARRERKEEDDERGVLERGTPGLRPPVLTLPGDTLERRPKMVLLTAAALASFGLTLGAALAAAPLRAGCGAAAGLMFADFLSGAFHWATDNYGSIQTPVVGFACAAFQGHHLAPWTIAHRGFANNVHKIAAATTPMVLAAHLSLPPAAAAFVSVALHGQMWAQEFHRWSHIPPRTRNRVQRALQARGLALTTREHGLHHRPPYDKHYCILTGGLNPLLDARPVLLWRRLEAFFYRHTGVEPNSWTEPGGDAVKALALAL